MSPRLAWATEAPCLNAIIYVQKIWTKHPKPVLLFSKCSDVSSNTCLSVHSALSLSKNDSAAPQSLNNQHRADLSPLICNSLISKPLRETRGREGDCERRRGRKGRWERKGTVRHSSPCNSSPVDVEAGASPFPGQLGCGVKPA